MPEFVKAYEGEEERTVVYEYADKTGVLKSRGTIAWSIIIQEISKARNSQRVMEELAVFGVSLFSRILKPVGKALFYC